MRTVGPLLIRRQEGLSNTLGRGIKKPFALLSSGLRGRKDTNFNVPHQLQLKATVAAIRYRRAGGGSILPYRRRDAKDAGRGVVTEVPPAVHPTDSHHALFGRRANQCLERLSIDLQPTTSVCSALLKHKTAGAVAGRGRHCCGRRDGRREKVGVRRGAARRGGGGRTRSGRSASIMEDSPGPGDTRLSSSKSRAKPCRCPPLPPKKSAVPCMCVS